MRIKYFLADSLFYTFIKKYKHLYSISPPEERNRVSCEADKENNSMLLQSEERCFVTL